MKELSAYQRYMQAERADKYITEHLGKQRKPKKVTASEHQEQCKVIDWKWLNMGRYPELINLFAIPNGGARDAITGALLKAEGVLAGVPDLFLGCARGGYHGLFIELKRIGGSKPEEHQLKVMNDLRKQG